MVMTTNPMGYSNPCARENYVHGGFYDAPLAVSGEDPDGKGGGVLFWAYSVSEANRAYFAFKGAGYNKVTISNGADD